MIEGATEHVYKKVGDVTLKLWAFKPADWKASDERPAIVFFFGGGWKSGSPLQFVPQSEMLAKRGMVAIVADYRVASRHGTKAKDCVADARDAMRYVRKSAKGTGSLMRGGSRRAARLRRFRRRWNSSMRSW